MSALGLKENPGPFCSGKRPGVLLAQLKLFAEGTTQIEPDPWLAIPAILFALEVIIEKALLQRHAEGKIEPLFVPTRRGLEPLVLRGGLGKRFEIPARMQAKSGPIGRT